MTNVSLDLSKDGIKQRATVITDLYLGAWGGVAGRTGGGLVRCGGWAPVEHVLFLPQAKDR